uniref:D-isomer specific 2-hydroxyacid dehydrogenase NAD-binding domain-containing protein n=1 Tax=Timema bartmani TaxID=61472 RepID=A0A7R9EXL2_9NEOP|nr:unnamed protein product [Timema bartmani]
MASSVKRIPSYIAVFSKVPNILRCLENVMPNVEFVNISPDAVSDAELQPLKEAEVIVADCNLLAPYLYHLNAKWIQGTWAGVEPLLNSIDSSKPPLSYQFTRFSGRFFGIAMAEYVVSNIVNWERDYKNVYRGQCEGIWIKDKVFADYRTISDLTIGILGMGAIGKHVSQVLKGFDAQVWAMARTIPEPKDRCPYVDEYRSVSELPDLLQNCDYVVAMLPATIETNNFLGGDILKNCELKKSVLMSVGRGNVISEQDIVKSIENGWISGAILDVFAQEPLPKTSLLWKIPQVIITPHYAATTRGIDVAKLFKENLEKYCANQPLPNIVHINKGY